MHGENNMEIYSHKCEMDIGDFLYASVNTNTQGHCDSLELWDGEDNGREVQEERDIWRTLVAV